jgi:trehalose 6-phosphate phosphatase
VRLALAPLLTDPSASSVISDFDGTLSPIVDRPELARPLPGTPELLARLARRFATVAVVSGRPASFLWEHLSVRDGQVAAGTASAPRFVGLYGLEYARNDGRVTPDPQASAWRPVIDQVVERLRSSAPAAGLVEAKGLAVTVHWRTAPDAEAWAVAAVASEAERTGLRAHPGRCSLELRPPLSIDKGSVLRGLVEGCRAAVYFGDDLGDLPAFAALAEASAEQGMTTVAVAVADTESPPEVLEAADLVLASPAEAAVTLEWLAEEADRGGRAG